MYLDVLQANDLGRANVKSNIENQIELCNIQTLLCKNKLKMPELTIIVLF